MPVSPLPRRRSWWTTKGEYCCSNIASGPGRVGESPVASLKQASNLTKASDESCAKKWVLNLLLLNLLPRAPSKSPGRSRSYFVAVLWATPHHRVSKYEKHPGSRLIHFPQDCL